MITEDQLEEWELWANNTTRGPWPEVVSEVRSLVSKLDASEARIAELEAAMAKVQEDTDCMCLGCDQAIFEGQCLSILTSGKCSWGRSVANHHARASRLKVEL